MLYQTCGSDIMGFRGEAPIHKDNINKRVCLYYITNQEKMQYIKL